jgi:hypothetical protein
MTHPISCHVCGSNLLTPERIEKALANKEALMVSGASVDCVGEIDVNPATILKKVVTAVVNGGQAHLLWEFPELLHFLGSRIPSRSELAGHSGVDERMFEAKAKWPNVDRGLL